MALEILPTQIYEKSFYRDRRTDLAGVFSGDFSEIRWDQNSDGTIDYWFIQKGPLTVQEYFKNGALQGIEVQKRMPLGQIRLVYKKNASGRLTLIELEETPFRVLLNTRSSFSVSSASSSHQSALPKKVDLCKQEIRSFSVLKNQWDEIEEALQKTETPARLRKMVSEQCLAVLTDVQREELDKSLNGIFGIDPQGIVEDNRYLACMASISSAQAYVPQFLQRVLTASVVDPKLKINCFKNTGNTCLPAKYSESTGQMDIPIPNSKCNRLGAGSFSENIFHETLHAAAGHLNEKSVDGIVQLCGKPGFRAEDLKNLNQLIQQEIQVVSYADNTVILDGPAAVARVNASVAAQKVTRIPKEIAERGFAPGKAPGDMSGMASLNSDFGQGSGTLERSRSAALARSQSRTSPVLQFANSLFQNALIPRAQAGGNGLKTAERPLPIRRGIASASQGKAVASAFPGIGRARSDSGERSANLTANSRLDVESTAFGLVTAQQRDVKLETGGAEGRIEQSPQGSAALGPRQQSGLARKHPSSGSGPVVGSDGGLGGGSGSGAIHRSGGGPARAEDRLSEQRRFVEAQLQQRTSSKLWAFIQKNEKTLKFLRIHILDSNNRVWGAPDPEKSVRMYRQRGERLVREH